MKLTPWESDSRLITLFAGTACITNVPTQSLLLVGPPGQGKTALIRRLSKLSIARLVSDMTSNGLRKLLVPDDKSVIAPRLLLMPEFMRLFSRDQSVSSQAANLLSNVMTGDAGRELIGLSDVDFTGVQIGIIGAVTTKVFEGQFGLSKQMESTGLLSRFQIIKVERDVTEQRRVMINMANNYNADLAPIVYPQLMQMKPIVYDNIACAGPLLDMLDSYEGLRSDERLLERMKSLVMSSALLCDRTTTTKEDVDIVELFLPYFLREKAVSIVWPFNKRKQ